MMSKALGSALISIILILGLTQSLQADVTQSIQKAVALFPEQPEQSVNILKSQYEASPQEWLRIKSLLLAGEHYSLYHSFLKSLRPELKVYQELVRMDFLMKEPDAALGHIQVLLSWTDPAAIGKSYSEYLIRPELSVRYTPYLTNTQYRQIIVWAFLSQNNVRGLDTMLYSPDFSRYYEKQEVRDYILRSWSYRNRDVGDLLTRYHLESDPDLQPFHLVSLYLRGDYSGMLKISPPQNKEQYSALEIDYPYLLSRARFFLGQYDESQLALQKCYFPWRYDLEALNMMNMIGLSQWGKARLRLRLLKSHDEREFFGIFLDLVQHKTNAIPAQLERYHTQAAMARSYQQEVMLITYTWYQDIKSLDKVTELIRQDILQNFHSYPAEPELAGLYSEYRQQKYTAEFRENVLSSFSKYQQALILSGQGRRDQAQGILLSLMEDEQASSLIRSLAVYQLRDIDQDQ